MRAKNTMDNGIGAATMRHAMSKKITLTGVLVVFLCLFTVFNVALCARYGLTMAYYRQLQIRVGQLQVENALVARNRALIHAVASDALEYSKKNPAIDPLLEQLGLKGKGATGAAPAAATAPAIKPPTK